MMTSVSILMPTPYVSFLATVRLRPPKAIPPENDWPPPHWGQPDTSISTRPSVYAEQGLSSRWIPPLHARFHGEQVIRQGPQVGVDTAATASMNGSIYPVCMKALIDSKASWNDDTAHRDVYFCAQYEAAMRVFETSIARTDDDRSIFDMSPKVLTALVLPTDAAARMTAVSGQITVTTRL